MNPSEANPCPAELAEIDPVLSKADFPLRATFFPLGFAVRVTTNSSEILAAAQASWGIFKQRFDYPPVTICIGVSASSVPSSELPAAPVCRSRQHLLSQIADAYNFIHCDLKTGFAFGWVTPEVAAEKLYLRYHILETAALCMISASHVTPLHAACVTIHGHGMLLCGDSGAGKSSLSFAGGRSGWSFTSDDASYLLLNRTDRMVIGNYHQFRLRDSGPQLFPELEGRSVTPRATGKPSIEIPTAELPGILTADSAIIRSIVFLNRRKEQAPGLIDFPRERALTWFRQSPLAIEAIELAQQAAISNLLNAPIFELHYTDLDWAVERLTTLGRTER